MKVSRISNATGNENGEKIMRNYVKILMVIAAVLLCAESWTQAAEPMQFRELFNGKDLSGWVNVNTDKVSLGIVIQYNAFGNFPAFSAWFSG